ncbi:hypothetical protein BST81_01895 [Leptolyngbya sp. 'hensonii']|uniref:heterocyst frequency control protein PatD n=1 Tax=Leptolyngbya sp. 'hensonii' TaxID=1922337 RepID=UPI00094FB21C|nr:heterocyst frequency control protein PatD [Leptolyngbya sp. 'hensonii']OLP20208.1 hypothetical protein BST81_01895 [Leptolyngbya sp. 'hensonii']
MLPPLYHESYREFQRLLTGLQDQVVQANPDRVRLQAEFLKVQQFFQLQILTLNPGDGAISQRLQALQTETNKQLRLLAVDISFLQAARQPATTQQRQAQIRDRLTTLAGYCEVVLQGKA